MNIPFIILVYYTPKVINSNEVISIPAFYLAILAILQTIENVSKLIYDYIIKNGKKKNIQKKQFLERNYLLL